MVKNPPANAGELRDASSISESGSSPEGRHSNPLQHSYRENPTDRGAWRAADDGVAQSQTRLKGLIIRQRQDQEMNTALFRDLQ